MRSWYFIRLSSLVLGCVMAASPGWASPVIDNTATTTDTDGTSTVVSMPSGITAGDLLLAQCAHEDANELSLLGAGTC
jgi:hypothetical protein